MFCFESKHILALLTVGQKCIVWQKEMVKLNTMYQSIMMIQQIEKGFVWAQISFFQFSPCFIQLPTTTLPSLLKYWMDKYALRLCDFIRYWWRLAKYFDRKCHSTIFMYSSIQYFTLTNTKDHCCAHTIQIFIKTFHQFKAARYVKEKQSLTLSFSAL